jgi:hypothetical protein
MEFLAWLESTAYTEWLLTSLVGWPLMLSIHALGLALTVGVVGALDLRLLGLYRTIPLTSVDRLLSVAWVGVLLNTISGVMIFVSQGTTYVTNVPFLVKIGFVILGSVNLAYTQRTLRRGASAWESTGQVEPIARLLAVSSLLFWTVALVTGRMIAYFSGV